MTTRLLLWLSLCHFLWARELYLSIDYHLLEPLGAIGCHLNRITWFDRQIPSLKSQINHGFPGTTLTVEPVEPITLIPAERHLPTASGTAARGGSIMEMRPRKQSCSVGKFMSSQSKVNPRGNCIEDRLKWQKPETKRGHHSQVTDITY